MRRPIILAVVLAFLPVCVNTAEARYKGSPNGGKSLNVKGSQSKAGRAQHGRGHGRGRHGSNPCAAGIPGTCNWISNHGRSISSDCLTFDKTGKTCGGTDPRLRAYWIALPPDSIREGKARFCMTLPMRSQASCMGMGWSELPPANAK